MHAVIDDVLVVGAGFAGMSAAISIAKLGKNVTLVERSTAIADGAAITLSNRAPDALRELGVLDDAIEAGIAYWDYTVYDRDFHDSAGHHFDVPSLPRREPDGLPVYLEMYRPTLARLLVERAAAAGVTERHGVAVDSVTNVDERVDVMFADGTAGSYDLVVAADGTNSRIREQIMPGRVSPHYSGHMSFRWVKADPSAAPSDGIFVRENGDVAFVHTLSGGNVYIAAGVDMPNRPVSRDEGVVLFRAALGQFTAPRVRELLDVVDGDDEIIVRPYTIHNVPGPWHSGRVLCIGDAMHTMSAHLGAGGVMALEDGVVLGQELAADGDLDATLVRFAHRRARRTFWATEACRQMLDLQVNYRAEPADLHRIREFAFTELIKPY